MRKERSSFKMKVKKMIRGVLSNRSFLLAALFLTVCTASYAANMSAGSQALGKVNEEVAKWFPLVKTTIYILAGIVGLTGGIGVYFKMNNDDQDVKKSIMMTVGGCLFLIVLAEALPIFFGLKTV